MAQKHNSYSPGHPWYYKLGGRILEVMEIEPPRDLSHYRVPPAEKIEASIASIQKEIDREVIRYAELREKGLDALSEFDRRSYFDDPMMPFYCAIGLVHNHICYYKGHLSVLEAENRKYAKQLTLF